MSPLFYILVNMWYFKLFFPFFLIFSNLVVAVAISLCLICISMNANGVECLSRCLWSLGFPYSWGSCPSPFPFFFFFLDMFYVVSQRFSIAQFAASCFATVDQNRSVSMSWWLYFLGSFSLQVIAPPAYTGLRKLSSGKSWLSYTNRNLVFSPFS